MAESQSSKLATRVRFPVPAHSYDDAMDDEPHIRICPRAADYAGSIVGSVLKGCSWCGELVRTAPNVATRDFAGQPVDRDVAAAAALVCIPCAVADPEHGPEVRKKLARLRAQAWASAPPSFL